MRSLESRSIGRSQAVEHALLVLPVVVTVWLMATYLRHHELGVDFRHDFWVAGRLVRHGLSPYDWSRAQIAQELSQSFPYPAPAALLFVPFSLLPVGLAALVFVALSIVACGVALWLLEVRDWRVYAVTLLWWPVINGWQTANVTLLLLGGIAALWRWRDRPVLAGVTAAALLAIKPIVWPLLLWLVLTRRFRAACVAVAGALALDLIGFAVLGFDQVGRWRHLLVLQTHILYSRGYALTALVVHLGGDRLMGTAVQVLVCAFVALACIRLRGDSRRVFTLAVVLMLTASPLLDNHYFALLVAPVALAAPTLSVIWIAPLVLWLCPATQEHGWQQALAWVVVALLAFRLVDTQPTGTPPNSRGRSSQGKAAAIGPSIGRRRWDIRPLLRRP